VPDASFEKARQAVEEHLARLEGGDRRIRAPLAFQIFTAAA
jgi:exonuclease VII small subunit